jgi:hypothetical protein
VWVVTFRKSKVDENLYAQGQPAARARQLCIRTGIFRGEIMIFAGLVMDG